LSAWLRWWYPGLRWTPETLASPDRERRARERAVDREILYSRLILCQVERLADAVEAVEQRLAALEAWKKQEQEDEFWGK
jgi:hypothetical protein